MLERSEALCFQTALQIAHLIATRQITSRAVTQYFLERIARSSALNAFTLVFAEQALAAADAADQALVTGQPLSPLHGVPVAIKDSIEMANTATSAGSLSRLTTISCVTATVVERLQAAGMVILGKTQMTEFAFGLSGQNPTRGTPWNPWDATLHRAPGGSSSGAAVAVAAGLVPIAVGGDTGGSIRAPASLNHLVGFKPSSGLISVDGVVPLAPSLDVLGPIARNVCDAQALTAIMASPCTHIGLNVQSELDDERVPAKPGSVFVLDQRAFPCALSNGTRRVWEQVLANLHTAGWTLEYWAPEDELDIGRLSECNSLIIAYEGYREFGDLAHDPAQPLWEVVRNRILAGAQISRDDYEKAVAHRASAAEAFTQAIGLAGVLMMPVSGHGALPLDDADTHHASIGTFSRAGNYLGTPAIALPAGFDEAQMPIGVQLLSPVGTDRHLLNMASALAPLLLLDPRTPALERWGL